MRLVPNLQFMTADQMVDVWHRQICPSSVRQLAIMELSKLEPCMKESDRDYLKRAESTYIVAQALDSKSDPNNEANFVTQVVNGIKDSRIRSIVRKEHSQILDLLRDIQRTAVVDFAIDSRMDDQQMSNIVEKASPKIMEAEGATEEVVGISEEDIMGSLVLDEVPLKEESPNQSQKTRQAGGTR